MDVTELFPFEKIEKNSRIIIYGAGKLGQEYLAQIETSAYCKCVGFIDARYEKYIGSRIKVYSPEEIVDKDFDYIVVATQNRKIAKEISDTIKKYFQIEDSNIIFVGARTKPVLLNDSLQLPDMVSGKYAFFQQCLSIAIRMSYGLGDCIMQKKVFEEIVKYSPDCKIDIYVAVGGKENLDAIFSNEKNVNLLIEDKDSTYEKNYLKYDVALWVTHIIEINHLDLEKINSKSPLLASKLNLLKKRTEEYALKGVPKREYYLHFMRSKYHNENAYTAYNYGDVFEIENRQVNIAFNKKYYSRADSFSLGKYITVNYGWGGLFTNVAKAWPAEYFEQFIEMFKKIYPAINVVQLGTINALKLKGIDSYVLGESLETVKYILKESIFHFDIEGGLVHLATQLGTKCIVLFGPTPVHYFGYPQNINIISQDCKECYLLYDDHTICARNMEKPECMYSITPTLVMQHVNDFLNLEKKNELK